MKKVININFQGRVIPIEESAFETLTKYIESLRRYFAHEEGREEIINDIEGRIAELFSELLKKGSTCITDGELESIIASMGRPEDFEAQDAEMGHSFQEEQQYKTAAAAPIAGRGRLYRNADDKILGGVCSGLANYLGIDPVIMRILFVVLFGALFWVYILLWIIVPSKSVQSNITKRLYRNPDGKVIAGVAGGLAAYFHIDAWIPRLIFALPFVLGLASGTFNAFWFDVDFGFVPRIVSGSLGWTLFLTYIILWIAVPIATTAADKLEMRGEKIDLNSIRNTVKEDLGSFRSRAERFSSEVNQSAKEFGEKARNFGAEAGERVKSFAAETAPAARRAGSGLGHIIGVLFKAFFLFIAGIIALSLFAVLIGLLFGGFALIPLKNFIIQGFTQNLLVWTSLIFLIAVPVVAIIIWIIRRISGARSKNHYLGYVFGTLWVLGLVSAVMLVGLVGRNFAVKVPLEEKVLSFQPANDRLIVDVVNNRGRYQASDWFGISDDDEWPFYGISEDSMLLRNIKVNIEKSRDSSYHVYMVRLAHGNSRARATTTAEKIHFDMNYEAGTLMLPYGFAISAADKFRNQGVLLVIEVPAAKRIKFDHDLRRFHWMEIDFNRNRGWRFEDNHDYWNGYGRWRPGQEYIMTENGLKVFDTSVASPGKTTIKLKVDDNDVQIDAEGHFEFNERSDTPYRYRDESRSSRKDSRIRINEQSSNTEAEGYDDLSAGSAGMRRELGTPLSVFSRLFQ